MRLLRWALLVEAAWLLLVNGLLALPPMQDWISAVRPEKFAVRWERAWTVAPFHVEARGVFANGSARRQMWQVEAASLSGWINPLPLIWKHVSLHRVAATDLDYRQRPRPRPDRDYADSEAFFPEIEGRTVRPVDESPYRGRRPWTVALNSVEVDGRLDYWVYRMRGEARGRLAGDLDYRTRGGPLRLDIGELDLQLGPHRLDGDQLMFEQAQARGSLGFAPFRPREDKGVALLRALYFDLDLDADLDSLAFLDVFLLDFRQFSVDGSGEVIGRLVYDRGVVKAGTDLAVAARDLQVALLGNRVEGLGTVSLRLGEETGGELALGFYYGDLRVLDETDRAELLTGQGLRLEVGGDGRLLPEPGEVNASRSIAVEIGRLDLPDFAAWQRYLPERWPFRLHGGSGVLSGSAHIRPTAYDVDLALESENADLGIDRFRFLADLDAALKLDNPDVGTDGAHVDGTFLRIENARLQRDEGPVPEPWSATLDLPAGRMELVGGRRYREANVLDLYRILAETRTKDLLAAAEGAFELKGAVSEVAWLGVFFGDNYRTRFAGAAQVEGMARIANGLPAPGTDLALRSDGLVFNFLDYATRGRGEVRLAVEEGGENPDWRLGLVLEDADLRRRDDRATFVRDVRIEAEALVEDVDLDGEASAYALAFRMPSGRVTDVAVFNRYLPPEAPLALIGGGATLSSELTLLPDDADGWVRLDARRIDLAVDGQDVRGDLLAEITVAGGRPADMAFDLAGSRLRLANVGVSGAETAFDDDGWTAELVLKRGDTVFAEPLKLDVDAELRASDSRPLVTLFRNQDGWRPEFIARALTVEGITGNARVEMADRRLRIPFAWVDGETIEAGAKAELSEAGNRGIVYFKYRGLDAVLRIADGKRNLDILRARRTFDDYQVP